MIYHTFSFNYLSAHQLIPYLINHLNSRENHCNNKQVAWHTLWLNNDNQPVIGILPKIAWTVQPSEPSKLKEKNHVLDNDIYIEIIKSSRQASFLDAHHSVDDIKKSCISNAHIYYSSYAQWIQQLIDYCQSQHQSQQTANATIPYNQETSAVEPANYNHGLMGFIGYDISAKALSPHRQSTNKSAPKISLTEQLTPNKIDTNCSIALANQPCAFLAHYDIYLTQDKFGWQLNVQPDTDDTAISFVMHHLQCLENYIASQQNLLSTHTSLEYKNTVTPALLLQASWTISDYKNAFANTQTFLNQGDSYQINLTQKWQGTLAEMQQNDIEQQCPITPRLVNYLPSLHQQTLAPFAGYLAIDSINQTAQKDHSNLNFELLSCSPELFVRFNKTTTGQLQIITKPIKGTVPRGKTSEEDEHLKQQLANSTKDKAENVMIVDLLRNDLGKYAETGSVKVPALFAIESFSNVHHMVSTIQATIKAEVHPLSVLFDSLPAGSITGAPKKRAVEIISDLEVGPRGAYCGTLGYLNFDGSGQWNVLIRSLQANKQGEVSLWAGGGITVGSNASSEYQECLDKVGNLLHILNPQS